MTENFPNMKKETDIQVHKAQIIPNEMNPNRPTPRHIIIKMEKVRDKERILKAGWKFCGVMNTCINLIVVMSSQIHA